MKLVKFQTPENGEVVINGHKVITIEEGAPYGDPPQDTSIVRYGTETMDFVRVLGNVDQTLAKFNA